MPVVLLGEIRDAFAVHDWSLAIYLDCDLERDDPGRLKPFMHFSLSMVQSFLAMRLAWACKLAKNASASNYGND